LLLTTVPLLPATIQPIHITSSTSGPVALAMPHVRLHALDSQCLIECGPIGNGRQCASTCFGSGLLTGCCVRQMGPIRLLPLRTSQEAPEYPTAILTTQT
jgi:hypothetical protein